MVGKKINCLLYLGFQVLNLNISLHGNSCYVWLNVYNISGVSSSVYYIAAKLNLIIDMLPSDIGCPAASEEFGDTCL